MPSLPVLLPLPTAEQSKPMERYVTDTPVQEATGISHNAGAEGTLFCLLMCCLLMMYCDNSPWCHDSLHVSQRRGTVNAPQAQVQSIAATHTSTHIMNTLGIPKHRITRRFFALTQFRTCPGNPTGISCPGNGISCPGPGGRTLHRSNCHECLLRI